MCFDVLAQKDKIVSYYAKCNTCNKKTTVFDTIELVEEYCEEEAVGYELTEDTEEVLDEVELAEALHILAAKMSNVLEVYCDSECYRTSSDLLINAIKQARTNFGIGNEGDE
jgi:hypothetical protein